MRYTKKLAVSAAAVALTTTAPLALSVATGAQPGLAASPASHAAAITVQKVGSFQVSAGSTSSSELRPPGSDDVAATTKAVANRSPHSRAKLTQGPPPPSGIVPTQTSAVTLGESGTEGLTHFDQRTADGGNQWSLVPPDQGLCTNGTQVVEVVNTALQVYDTNGKALMSEPQSLNQLYWGDHEVVRGPPLVASVHQMGDPSCVYDAGSHRYFLTVYDAVSDSAGNPTGPSFIDIAVSPRGTALGTWQHYQLDTTDDGTDGTPNHTICDGDAGGCFGDYPHLGTDANGLYITTNEYPTFGDGSGAAQVYGIAKSALVAGTAKVPAVQFDTTGADLNQGTYYNGFTLAPALSNGTDYDTADKGTMYFLSSDAWAGDNPFVSDQILVWSLTNTSALARNPTAVSLTHSTVPVNAYYPPPASDQRPGSVPLADCLNVTSCAKVALGTPDRYKETEYAFDSSDSRMLQSAYADGLLWGALDTAVDVSTAGGTVTKAGVAYYVVDPSTMTAINQGTVAAQNANNISFPAVGVTSAGKAVMALTLVGQDYFPSAAYVTFDSSSAASDITVVGAGQSPDDDFSGYRGFGYDRPRWGDYGAAAVSGDTVWIASEYIAQQRCSLAQFESTSFTCGNNQRTVLANWATHIAAVPTG